MAVSSSSEVSRGWLRKPPRSAQTLLKSVRQQRVNRRINTVLVEYIIKINTTPPGCGSLLVGTDKYQSQISRSRCYHRRPWRIAHAADAWSCSFYVKNFPVDRILESNIQIRLTVQPDAHNCWMFNAPLLSNGVCHGGHVGNVTGCDHSRFTQIGPLIRRVIAFPTFCNMAAICHHEFELCYSGPPMKSTMRFAYRVKIGTV